MARRTGERHRKIDKGESPTLSDWTIHGGRLSRAQQAFPLAPAPWVDLSTGINPEAWPGIAGLSFDWQRLPDDGALHALEAVAATHFGTNGPHVLALPGTEFGLHSLRNLGLPGPFRCVSPGYSTHGVAFPNSVPIAFGTLMDEASRGGTILLANPANPDGRLISVAYLLTLAGTAAKAGGWRS